MQANKTIFQSIDEMSEKVGKEIGLSSWFRISQSRINDFARVTFDEQWIHTDEQKAREVSPFGTTIAHGYLLISLMPKLLAETYAIEKVKMGINYGTDKVRFISPVKSGSRIRLRSELMSVENNEKGARIKVKATIELEYSSKPACVAELIALVFV